MGLPLRKISRYCFFNDEQTINPVSFFYKDCMKHHLSVPAVEVDLHQIMEYPATFYLYFGWMKIVTINKFSR